MSKSILGFPRTNPMTWGWDVSTINPRIIREGSGFLGYRYNKAVKLKEPLYSKMRKFHQYQIEPQKKNWPDTFH